MPILLFACRGVPPGDTPEDSAAPESPDSVETIGEAGAPADSGCGLVSDLTDANFLEGDTVHLTVACSGTLATDDALVALVRGPPGASFDADTRTFRWETSPADGGRIDLVFSILPREGEIRDGEIPDSDTLTFWVADNPARADNVAVDPAAYTEEWGLPVVHIETAATLGTAAYADATVTWHGRAYPAGVQIHGKTSSHYPKLSYALKFDAEELPIEAWDVTRDHLFLITTFDDNSYVRQKFVYDLWAAIAAYRGQARLTPRAFFTVVYMNGSYLGLYVGEDRVDNEFLDQMGFERDANLYKAVESDANFALTDVYGVAKTVLHQGYEKVEGEPADDFADLDALVGFTGSSTSAELIAGSGDWLDLDELMDAYLLLFYTNAEDSYTKNMFLYHPPAGGRFRYVPWDFNASWGQNWRTYRVAASFEDDGAAENRIFWAMRDDAGADASLWARFAELRSLGPLALSWQTATLDTYFARIDRSAQRDWDVWGPSYRTYHNWVDRREERADWTDYQGEKAYLYQWVADRAAYFEAAHP
ncbi:MAG: CotH kinase family protein [Pseudomonadota bacterium]|nr:CotH kinase family protein [Pseudomonadota bacterium]